MRRMRRLPGIRSSSMKQRTCIWLMTSGLSLSHSPSLTVSSSSPVPKTLLPSALIRGSASSLLLLPPQIPYPPEAAFAKTWSVISPTPSALLVKGWLLPLKLSLIPSHDWSIRQQPNPDSLTLFTASVRSGRGGGSGGGVPVSLVVREPILKGGQHAYTGELLPAAELARRVHLLLS